MAKLDSCTQVKTKKQNWVFPRASKYTGNFLGDPLRVCFYSALDPRYYPRDDKIGPNILTLACKN